MAMFALVIRLDLVDEKAADAFDRLTEEAVAQVTAHGIPLTYATYRVDQEPLARIFYEVYADETAFKKHQQTDYMRAYHEAKQPLIAARRLEFLNAGPAFTQPETQPGDA